MNAKEVMQALLDGKKVRISLWTIDSYIVLNSNELVNNAGQTVSAPKKKPRKN